MKISNRALSGPASGIRRMFELARNYENVVNLCIGEPGFGTPDNIIESACEALHEGHTKYTSNAGVLELREALAAKLEKDNHIVTDPAKNLIVTTGAGEAIMLSMLTLVNPGDEVIIPDPCWPNYYGHIGIAEGVAVPAKSYEKDGFALTAASIESVVTDKTKVLIINSPSNPTGAVIEREELLKIGKLAKKYDFMIVSDEPYEKLIYDGNEHFSLGSVEELKDYVITVNSFSKTYSMTGWRVGYAVGPESVIQPMVKLQENLSSCVNSAAQQACIEALNGPQSAVDSMVAEYKKRRDLLVNGINELPGFSCLAPKGAFYAFVNIQGLGVDSERAAEQILESIQVVTTPGSAFGQAGEGYLRISFASSTEDIEEALERLKKHFQ